MLSLFLSNALEHYDKYKNTDKYSNLIIAEVNGEILPELMIKLPDNKDLKNINGFPTIVYIKPGGKVGNNFTLERTTENLAKFIDSNYKKQPMKKQPMKKRPMKKQPMKKRFTKKRSTRYVRKRKQLKKSRRKQR